MAGISMLCSLLLPVPPVSFPSSSQVPPVPLSAPRLLAKQSRQLVVSPVDSFSGDGPITSIKLFYKPKDDNSAWSSIVGMCLQGWRTQMEPVWEGEIWSGQMSPHQAPHGDAEENASCRLDCGFDMFFWPTVDNSENITLMNLRPVTAYIVKVQLSRPGAGGEGSKGPEAIMVTDCLGEPPSP